MEGCSESGRNVHSVPKEGTGVRTWRGEEKRTEVCFEIPRVCAVVVSKLPFQSGSSEPSIPHKTESSSYKALIVKLPI